MELFGDLAEQYLEFGVDAHEESPCFEEWSRGVARDPDVLAWLSDLPRIKQQPNLVFAAARWHGAPAPGPYDGLRRALLGDDARVRQTILGRATQTNEVGRLATLTPLLGTLAGPLALLEVGTSAGLCLYPDRYDYEWPSAGALTGSGGPTLTCAVSGDVPVPGRHPHVAWRAGVDLNPLDVTDPDAMAWLAMLVWPEQDDRRALLLSAIDVARADPPRIVPGHLLEELPALVEEAGRHGTPVVFHSAVVAYLDHDDRCAFAELMRGLVAEGRCRWVSNEAPGVVPRIEGPRLPAHFVLALDGRPVASTQGHGRALAWF